MGFTSAGPQFSFVELQFQSVRRVAVRLRDLRVLFQVPLQRPPEKVPLSERRSDGSVLVSARQLVA